MRRMSFLLPAAAMMAMAMPAMADSINFVGAASYNTTGTTTVNNLPQGFYEVAGDSITLGAATGVFDGFPNLLHYSEPSFTFPTTPSGSPYLLLGYEGNYLYFTADTFSESYADGFLSITEYGTITLDSADGVDTTYNGIFQVSTQGGADGNDASFSATLSTVPEPTSVALLGTGLLGFAGVIRRKFIG